MKARVLPVEEWPRLAGTDAEQAWPALDPRRSVIVVVEDDDRIVAHHILLWVLHAEGLWVDPAYRHGLAGGRLWARVRVAVQEEGCRGFLTAAIDETVRGLITHVGGTEVPGTHYMVPVENVTCR